LQRARKRNIGRFPREGYAGKESQIFVVCVCCAGLFRKELFISAKEMYRLFEKNT